jgi:hypothetical protein
MTKSSERVKHRFPESDHSHGNVVFNFKVQPVEDLRAFTEVHLPHHSSSTRVLCGSTRRLADPGRQRVRPAEEFQVEAEARHELHQHLANEKDHR